MGPAIKRRAAAGSASELLSGYSTSSLVVALIKRIVSSATSSTSILRAFLCAAAAILLRRVSLKLRRKSVRGRTVLITGAATGIGRAQAFAFAKLGARIVLWDIAHDQLLKTAEDVRKATPGASVYAYKCDLSKRQQIYEVAKAVKAEVGSVWALVNNAGIISGQEFLKTEDRRIELTMAVNTMAHFWTAKAFLPDMLAANSGAIVTISSAAGVFVQPRMVDYCTSKFAARGLSLALRSEVAALGKSGVRVSCICPAHINTDLFKGYDMMGMTMEPSYVADKVVDAVQHGWGTVMLPPVLTPATIVQEACPQTLWDLFTLPTNSTMNKWDPTKANKVFDAMEKK